MKTIYSLIISFITISLFSQQDYTRYYNSWRLGINGGVAWQTSDVRSCYGGAGGFTLEKGLNENATNIFSFAIRGRYLGANTYGMNYDRNYNLQNNSAYNGNYNPTVNYVDSVSSGKRYIYDNYKTQLNEGSLELQLTFNKLREQKHILLNLWGGIGFTSFRTSVNMLNENGQRYNFSKIDSTDGVSSALLSYNTLVDKSYESNGLGSKKGNVVTFSPSFGVGLGYQFSPGFSMLWEYKVTVPQGINADLLDGKYNNNSDHLNGNKDYYHYTGLNLLFTLRAKKKEKVPENETTVNNYNYQTPTNTVIPTNTVSSTNNIVSTPTVVSNPVVVQTPTVAAIPKPIITYITPSFNGQVTNNQQYSISAQILNVTSANQIKFYVNTVQVLNFNFDASTHILTYLSSLNLGSNPIQIKATNAAGSDNQYTAVVYEKPIPKGNPPTVEIVNPRICPFTSQTQQYSLLANTNYITNKNQVVVKINNVATYNFSLNVTNGQITLPLTLLNGNNAIFISVTNDFGNDIASCNIQYNEPIQAVALPIITIINPPQSGYQSSNQSYVVNATILNVPAANNISLYFNGLSTPFTYNINTKQFSFTANLNEGSNSVAISAYNAAGEDNKTTSIVYHAPVAQGNPPVVNLITPNQINSSNATPLYHFKFAVLNVNSKNDVTLTYNGSNATNFTYNTLSKEVLFDTYLVSGTNSLTVKGSNSFGKDSKTVYVNFQQRVINIKNPPKVSFINPLLSPATTINPNYTYKATITNIANNTGLVVKFNGNVVTNYNFNNGLFDYNATLINGSNVLDITATNTDGTDNAAATVNIKIKKVLLLPIVSLMKPMQASITSTVSSYNFNLAVINVASQNDIEVTYNGVNQSNFTYNNISTIVDFTGNLNVGNNTFTVKGTNQDGSDSKTVNVIYEPVAVIKTPPSVSFITPSANTATVSNMGYTFKATIENISNNAGLVVKFNGTPISNYSFNGSVVQYNATLINGNNVLEVTATNADGSDSKTAYVNYKPVVISRPPVISIITPANTPTVSSAAYVFNFTVVNATQNQITVKLNNTIITDYAFSGNAGSFSQNLNNGLTILQISATNDDGTDARVAQVFYNEPVIVTQPTVAVNPTDTASNKKITICHIPPGNNQNPQTITIPVSALQAHLAHGDVVGGCVASVKILNSDAKKNITTKPTEIVSPIKQEMKVVVDTTKKVITQPTETIKRQR